MEYQLHDLSTKKTLRVSEDALKNKLDQIKAVMDHIINKLKAVSGYQLDTIKVSVGFESGAFVFAVKGGIELTYGIKKP
jgi:hypothetical protein